MEVFQELLARTDAGYRRWLASITDDVHGETVTVYCLDALPERHTTYGIGEWLPGYLMIGQDGDRGMFLECAGGGGPVFWADLGSRGQADLGVLAPAFGVWLRSGFALPSEPADDLPPAADVYVDSVPADALQLLVRLRTLLGVHWRFADLRGCSPPNRSWRCGRLRCAGCGTACSMLPSCGRTCTTPPTTAWKQYGRPARAEGPPDPRARSVRDASCARAARRVPGGEWVPSAVPAVGGGFRVAFVGCERDRDGVSWAAGS
ncbi:hypothetical protein ACQP00_28500 [Dactylosporangium sp. CS-047395]|uniref:hypothetical protein n=1 Tax=Dactylosporangium sp. CS-047395 TaxID=3239936 RepID=UPI003D8DD8CB